MDRTVDSPYLREELPITEYVRAIVAQEMNRRIRTTLWGMARGFALPLCLVSIVALPLLIPIGDKDDVNPFFVIILFVAVLVGFVIYVSWKVEAPYRRDLEETTYLRVSGPIHLSDEESKEWGDDIPP